MSDRIEIPAIKALRGGLRFGATERRKTGYPNTGVEHSQISEEIEGYLSTQLKMVRAEILRSNVTEEVCNAHDLIDLLGEEVWARHLWAATDYYGDTVGWHLCDPKNAEEYP